MYINWYWCSLVLQEQDKQTKPLATHSHCTSATAPRKGSEGKGEGILIPSSDPLLEERQLNSNCWSYSSTKGPHSYFLGLPTGGSGRKLRNLSPPTHPWEETEVLPRFGLHKTVTQKQSKESDYLNPTGRRANSCAKLQIFLWNVGPPLPASTGKSRRSLEGMLCTQSLTQGKGGKATRPALGHPGQLNTCLFQQFLPWLAHNKTPRKLRGENSSSHELGFIFGNLDSFVTMVSCLHPFCKAFKTQNSLLVNKHLSNSAELLALKYL